jgi:hypothetical protein
MATTPTIQYLQLDASYDPIFDSGASLTDLDAVNQAILTRLKLFLGEWWENLSIGLPMFQSILGQLASPQGVAAMTLAIQQNIQGAPYVTSAADVSVAFAAGRLSVTGVAQTQFGPVTVNTSPALGASLTT